MKLSKLHLGPTAGEIAAAGVAYPNELAAEGPPANLNRVTISEGSLSRLLSQADRPFAILTAYRGEFGKSDNIKRNRDLGGYLNQRKMGVQQLIGHYQEVPAGANPDTCPDELKVDVLERSFWVSKPADMPVEEFQNIIASYAHRYGQDSYLFYDGVVVTLQYNNGTSEVKGPLKLLGKAGLARIYSTHIKKPDVHFVFEGIEAPVNNMGRMGWLSRGLIIPPSTDKTRDLFIGSVN